jgi:hypothetical protein
MVDNRGDWRTTDGFNWTKYKPDGTPETNAGTGARVTWQGTASVSSDGSLTETKPDRSINTISLDGKPTTVAGDGAVTTPLEGGKTKITADDGSYKILDNKGRVVESERNGIKRTYEYTDSGYFSTHPFKVTRETGENAVVWETDRNGDGTRWTSNTNPPEVWNGVVYVNREGQQIEISLNGNRRIAGQTEWQADNDLLQRAKEINRVLNFSGNLNDLTLDRRAEVVRAQLESVNEAQMKVLNELFKRESGGQSLEAAIKDKFDNKRWLEAGRAVPGIAAIGVAVYALSGDHRREEMLNLLRREDAVGGVVGANNAGELHLALTELNQRVEGRSKEASLAAIRAVLSSLTAEQIAQMGASWQKQFGGDGDIKSHLLNQPAIRDSAFNKAFIETYMKGRDNVTAADQAKLIVLAAQEKNVRAFAQACQMATPQARELAQKTLLENHPGRSLEGALSNYFPETTGALFPQGDLLHAQEHLRNGKPSVGGLVLDSERWLRSNDVETINKVIADMVKPEDNMLYQRGEYVARNLASLGNLSDKDTQALRYFNEWEQKIQSIAWLESSREALRDKLRGETVLGELYQLGGNVYSSSFQTISQTLERMGRHQLDNLIEGGQAHLDLVNGTIMGRFASGVFANFGADKQNLVVAHLNAKLEVARQVQQMDAKDLKNTPYFNRLVKENPNEWNAFLEGRRIYDRLMQEPGTANDRIERQRKEEGLSATDKQNLEAFRKHRHEAVNAATTRGIFTAIDHATSTVSRNDRAAMVDAVLHMNYGDQARVRDDPTFRQQVLDTLRSRMGADNMAFKAAESLVQQIANGQPPQMGLIEKMYMHAFNGSTLGLQSTNDRRGAVQNVVNDLLVAMADSETRRDLRTNSAYRERVLEAARQAVGNNAVNDIIKPLVEGGSLTAEGILHLSTREGFTGSDGVDPANILRTLLASQESHLAGMSADGKNKLANVGYELSLPGAGGPTQAVVRNILEQGKATDVDKVRLFALGWDVVSKEEVSRILSRMTPEARRELSDEYGRRYNANLAHDVRGKLSSSDMAEFNPLLRTAEISAQGLFNQSVRQGTRSEDTSAPVAQGALRLMQSNLGDFHTAVTQANLGGQPLAGAELERLERRFAESLGLWQSAKAELAETVTTTTITVAAMAAAPFTMGESLSILPILYAGMAAGTMKVAANALIQGGDYQLTMKNVGRDLASGFVDGAVNMINPAHLPGLSSLTQGVAGKAAVRALEDAAVAGIAGAEAKRALEAGMNKLISEAVTAGKNKISAEAIEALATQLVSSKLVGAEAKEALTGAIGRALHQEMGEMSKNFVLRAQMELLQAGLSGTVGGAGAVASTTVQQVFDGHFDARQFMSSGLEGFASGVFMHGLSRGAHLTYESRLGHWAETTNKPLAHVVETGFHTLNAVQSAVLGQSMTGMASAGEVHDVAMSGVHMGAGSIASALTGHAAQFRASARHGALTHSGHGAVPHGATIDPATGRRPAAEGTHPHGATHLTAEHGSATHPTGESRVDAPSARPSQSALHTPVEGRIKPAAHGEILGPNDTLRPGREFQDGRTGIRIKIQGEEPVSQRIVEDFLRAADKLERSHGFRPSELVFEHNPQDTAAGGQSGYLVRVNTGRMAGQSAEFIYNHETGHIIDFEAYRKVTAGPQQATFQQALARDIQSPEMNQVLQGSFPNLSPVEAQRLQQMVSMMAPKRDQFSSFDHSKPDQAMLGKLARNEVFAEGQRLYQLRQEAIARGENPPPSYKDLALRNPLGNDTDRARMMSALERTFQHLEDNVFKPLEAQRVAARQEALRAQAEGRLPATSLDALVNKFEARSRIETQADLDKATQHLDDFDANAYKATRADLFKQIRELPAEGPERIEALRRTHETAEILMALTRDSDGKPTNLNDGIAALSRAVETELKQHGVNVESQHRGAIEHAATSESLIDAGMTGNTGSPPEANLENKPPGQQQPVVQAGSGQSAGLAKLFRDTRNLGESYFRPLEARAQETARTASELASMLRSNSASPEEIRSRFAQVAAHDPDLLGKKTPLLERSLNEALPPEKRQEAKQLIINELERRAQQLQRLCDLFGSGNPIQEGPARVLSAAALSDGLSKLQQALGRNAPHELETARNQLQRIHEFEQFANSNDPAGQLLRAVRQAGLDPSQTDHPARLLQLEQDIRRLRVPASGLRKLLELDSQTGNHLLSPAEKQVIETRLRATETNRSSAIPRLFDPAADGNITLPSVYGRDEHGQPNQPKIRINPELPDGTPENVRRDAARRAAQDAANDLPERYRERARAFFEGSEMGTRLFGSLMAPDGHLLLFRFQKPHGENVGKAFFLELHPDGSAMARILPNGNRPSAEMHVLYQTDQKGNINEIKFSEDAVKLYSNLRGAKPFADAQGTYRTTPNRSRPSDNPDHKIGPVKRAAIETIERLRSTDESKLKASLSATVDRFAERLNNPLTRDERSQALLERISAIRNDLAGNSSVTSGQHTQDLLRTLNEFRAGLGSSVSDWKLRITVDQFREQLRIHEQQSERQTARVLLQTVEQLRVQQSALLPDGTAFTRPVDPNDSSKGEVKDIRLFWVLAKHLLRSTGHTEDLSPRRPSAQNHSSKPGGADRASLNLHGDANKPVSSNTEIHSQFSQEALRRLQVNFSENLGGGQADVYRGMVDGRNVVVVVSLNGDHELNVRARNDRIARVMDEAADPNSASRHPVSAVTEITSPDGNRVRALVMEDVGTPLKAVPTDPAAEASLKLAMVKRLIAGALDIDGNIGINAHGVVRNFDYGERDIFSQWAGPRWDGNLARHYQNQFLTEEGRAYAARIVQEFGTPEGQRRLMDLGLTQKEAQSLVSRAEVLAAEHSRFPRDSSGRHYLDGVPAGIPDFEKDVLEAPDRARLNDPEKLAFDIIKARQELSSAVTDYVVMTVGDDKPTDHPDVAKIRETIAELHRQQNALQEELHSRIRNGEVHEDYAYYLNAYINNRSDMMLSCPLEEIGIIEHKTRADRAQVRTQFREACDFSPGAPAFHPEALAALREVVPHLTSPHAMESFHACISDLAHAWNEDLSQPLRRSNELQLKTLEAAAAFEDAKLRKLSEIQQRIMAAEKPEFRMRMEADREARRQGLSSDEAQTFVNEQVEARRKRIEELANQELLRAMRNPEDPLGQLHDEWQKLRSEHAEAVRNSRDQVELRRQQLQEMLDSFASDHGLPAVKLELVDHLDTAGAYAPGEGTIKISRSDLARAHGGDALVTTLFHEYLHSDQDHLLVRQMIEEERIKNPNLPIADLLLAVQDNYRKTFNYNLSNEMVLEAARLQEERGPLQAYEKERARYLQEQWTDHLDTPRYKYLSDTLRVIETQLNRLAGTSETKVDRLLFHLNENPMLRERLFGGESEIPQTIRELMDAQRAGNAFDRATAELLLIEHLVTGRDGVESRIEQVKREMKELVEHYFGAYHEQEAYAIEGLLRDQIKRLTSIDGKPGSKAWLEGETNNTPVIRTPAGDLRAGQTVISNGTRATVAGQTKDGLIILHQPGGVADPSQTLFRSETPDEIRSDPRYHRVILYGPGGQPLPGEYYRFVPEHTGATDHLTIFDSPGNQYVRIVEVDTPGSHAYVSDAPEIIEIHQAQAQIVLPTANTAAAHAATDLIAQIAVTHRGEMTTFDHVPAEVFFLPGTNAGHFLEVARPTSHQLGDYAGQDIRVIRGSDGQDIVLARRGTLFTFPGTEGRQDLAPTAEIKLANVRDYALVMSLLHEATTHGGAGREAQALRGLIQSVSTRDPLTLASPEANHHNFDFRISARNYIELEAARTIINEYLQTHDSSMQFQASRNTWLVTRAIDGREGALIETEVGEAVHTRYAHDAQLVGPNGQLTDLGLRRLCEDAHIAPEQVVYDEQGRLMFVTQHATTWGGLAQPLIEVSRSNRPAEGSRGDGQLKTGLEALNALYELVRHDPASHALRLERDASSRRDERTNALIKAFDSGEHSDITRRLANGELASAWAANEINGLAIFSHIITSAPPELQRQLLRDASRTLKLRAEHLRTELLLDLAKTPGANAALGMDALRLLELGRHLPALQQIAQTSSHPEIRELAQLQLALPRMLGPNNSLLPGTGEISYMDGRTGLKVTVKGTEAIPAKMLIDVLAAAERLGIRPSEVVLTHNQNLAVRGQYSLGRYTVTLNDAGIRGRKLEYTFFHETGHLIDHEHFRRFFSQESNAAFRDILGQDLSKDSAILALQEAFSLSVEQARELRRSLRAEGPTWDAEGGTAFRTPEDKTRYLWGRNEIFAEAYGLYRLWKESATPGGTSQLDYHQLVERFTAPRDANRARLMLAVENSFWWLVNNVFEPVHLQREAALNQARSTGPAGTHIDSTLSALASRFQTRNDSLTEFSQQFKDAVQASDREKYLEKRQELFRMLQDRNFPKEDDNSLDRVAALQSAHNILSNLFKITGRRDPQDGIMVLAMSVESDLAHLGAPVQDSLVPTHLRPPS